MESNKYLSLIEAGIEDWTISSSHMFGLPCLKVHGKVFAVAFEAGVVLKLPQDIRNDALKIFGAELWAAFSETHIKKEWVYFKQINEKDVRSFSVQAANYVAQRALQNK